MTPLAIACVAAACLAAAVEFALWLRLLGSSRPVDEDGRPTKTRGEPRRALFRALPALALAIVAGGLAWLSDDSSTRIGMLNVLLLLVLLAPMAALGAAYAKRHEREDRLRRDEEESR